ncbi:ATPase [Variovorax sp. ZS18.2.2]|uniref:ATPase n=1 Tax=Variovorax sp. ZS18.2.2 TaxID=2971255 RepID=UPI002150D8E5|nr:ATPase [Variovorax sp. ZS18.2.2]MCR6475461.1 ATPase [Variovorax sp. ZS18.2.2]
MKRRLKVILTIFGFAFLASCGGGEGEKTGLTAPSGETGTTLSPRQEKFESEEGYPLTAVIWPEREIAVCWQMDVDAFNSYSAQRESVRQAIHSTWEQSSLVRFIGWQRCNGTPNQGVSIAVQDVGAHTKGLGTRLRNVVEGVVLNFEYTQWSPDCQNQKDYCNRVLAVHEFGHVLGFAHEQNRPDTPDPRCAAQEQGTDGDALFGDWDISSVMNYCNPQWNGDGALSPTDIAMVKKYYGDPAGIAFIDITPSIYLLTN